VNTSSGNAAMLCFFGGKLISVGYFEIDTGR